MKRITDREHYLWVFIIESPSSEDFFTKRYEGEVLHKFLTWRGIKSFHYFAVNKNSFQKAIKNLIRDTLGEGFKISGLCKIDEKPLPMFLPIIHISAHGNEKSISLTSRELITWEELKELLLPLNIMFNEIILSISACEGWNAIKMLFGSKSIPFKVLISNKGKPTWDQALIGFTVIYHQLAEGMNFSKAIEAAKSASNNNDFVYLSVPEIIIQTLFSIPEIKKLIQALDRLVEFFKDKNKNEMNRHNG